MKRDKLKESKLACKVMGCNKGIESIYTNGFCEKHFKLSMLPIGLKEEIDAEDGE